MTRARYETKVITPAADPLAIAEPEIGRLWTEHGRVVCSCGRVIAACPHLGHGQVLRTVERGCQVCQGG